MRDVRHWVMVTALLLPGAPAWAESPATAEFGAWRVACDSTAYCEAVAEAAGPEASGRLALGRHGQETYWELSFEPAVAADPATPVAFGVDGAEAAFLGPGEIAPYGAARRYFLLGPKAQLVLDRLVPGRVAAVGFAGPGGPLATRFDLDGLADALIFIDTWQRRLGSERVAEAPPIGLERAGSAAPLSPNLPDALLERRLAEADCAQPDQVRGTTVITGRLGEGKAATTVYLVPCNTTAAGTSWLVYTGDGDAFTRHAFAEFWPSLGWTATTRLYGADLDEASGTIGAVSSGGGSCGSAALYSWTGLAFRLEEFRAREACDGVAGDLPLLYRHSARDGGQPRGRPAQ